MNVGTEPRRPQLQCYHRSSRLPLCVPYTHLFVITTATEAGGKQIYLREVNCQARTFITMSGPSLTRVTHNFISETSSSTSSSACTRSCLGVRVTRYGFGVRADSPS